jgi:heterotetrameric sarcosine oxidase gamma subunit
MAEQPFTDGTHRGGFAGLSRRIGSGVGVTAVERAGFAAASVLARKGQAGAAAKALAAVAGAIVPDGPKRVTAGGLTVLGTGPGAWLVLAERPSLVADLAASLASVAAVVDQSDAYAVLALSGPRLTEVLQTGVRVDLHPSGFSADDVAVTAVAHVGVILWMSDDRATVILAAPRSIAGSLLHWVEAAARPYGLVLDAD